MGEGEKKYFPRPPRKEFWKIFQVPMVKKKSLSSNWISERYWNIFNFCLCESTIKGQTSRWHWASSYRSLTGKLASAVAITNVCSMTKKYYISSWFWVVWKSDFTVLWEKHVKKNIFLTLPVGQTGLSALPPAPAFGWFELGAELQRGK